MKKAVYRGKDQYRCFHAKPTKKKEFFVEPARVQLDQYMLKQIKKNKRSVKSLSKEVVALKKEVERLQDQHDDYMLLEKTRAQEYSQSHLAFMKRRSQNRIALTQQQQPKGKKSTSRNHSKDSSLLSISSSAKSFSSHKCSSKSKKSRVSDVEHSKTRLSRKIEELKTKALLQQSEKERIKKEVKKKITKALQQGPGTPTQQGSDARIQDMKQKEGPLDEEYQRLIELLKTSKTIKSPSSTKKDSPKVTQFKEQPQLQRKESLIVEEDQKNHQPQKIRSIDSIPLKSTRAIEEQHQERRLNHDVEDNLKSQTNLLQSSPSRSPEQSPQKKRKPLQMSRAVEVRIVNEHHSEVTQGSGAFEGIFGSPAMEVRSGTVEMSFEAGDSSKRRLRELQFEFDQLVRQQLIASDPKEKEILSQTIRSVLFSINQLKGKLGKDSRDSD